MHIDDITLQKFYEEAFVGVYGKYPAVRFERGFFYLAGGKRVSRAELKQRALVLYAKAECA